MLTSCLAAIALACGFGTTPTAGPPILSDGSVLTFTRGDTHAPVEGAAVTVGSRRYTTDATGQIRLAAAVTLGREVDVSEASILTRQTSLRSATELQFDLWPRTTASGVDEVFTQDLVYRNSGPGGLIRPVVRTVWVAPSAEIMADPVARQSHIEAAALVTRATEGRLTFAVDPDATAGVIIRSRIDPAHPLAATGAGATRDYDGRAIVGGTIVFGGMFSARCLGVVLHELGHEFGLGHSPDGRDLMGPGPCFRGDFSEREKTLMNLMLQRSPGNQFPDDDRNVTTYQYRAESTVSCTF